MDIITKVKKQPTHGKIFTNQVSDNTLVSRIYKEHLRFKNKKTNNPIYKWAKCFNRRFSKEDTQMDSKPMSACSTPLATREIKPNHTAGPAPPPGRP